MNNEYLANQTGYQRRERLVGLFIFSGFILFLFFVFVSVKNQHMFEQRIPYYIELASSEGISKGGRINMLGSDIGEISDLHLVQGRKIRVEIAIYKSQRKLIRTDTKVIINRLASIGNAQIVIQSDSIDAPLLPEGSLIPVEETFSLNDLIFGVARIIKSADNKAFFDSLANIMPKLESTIGNIDTVLQQVAQGEGVVNSAIFDEQLANDLKSITRTGVNTLSEAEAVVKIARQRLLQIQPALDDATQVTQNVRTASADLPKMLNDLQTAIAQTNQALSAINTELNDLPGITVEAKRALRRTNHLLQSVQNTWPLSSNHPTVQSAPLITPQAIHD